MAEIPENERIHEEAPVQFAHSHHHRRRAGNGVWGGLVLVLLGVIFLFQQVGNFSFRNWWALFILIPALSSIGAAWGVYRNTGRFTHPGVLGPLYGAGYPLMVTLIFLFELNWGDWWPVFVMWGALGMLASGVGFNLSRDHEVRLPARVARPWIGWTGLGAFLFGLAFLYFNLTHFFLGGNWWAIFIFFPAVGGLISTIRLAQARGGFGALAVLNLSAALVIAAVGTIALMGLDWNLILPIALIAAGILAFLSAVLRPGRGETA